VLSNWHRHLAEVYEGGSPPEGVASDLQRAVKRFGRDLPIARIDFPQPSRWVIDWLPEGQAETAQPSTPSPAPAAPAVGAVAGPDDAPRCGRCGQEFATPRLLQIHSKRCK
jgi:hypothetical protein